MWRDDGWDTLWRIGLLLPQSDVGPESEFRAVTPSDIGVHAARVDLGQLAADRADEAAPPSARARSLAAACGLDDAVLQLAAAPLQAIGLCITRLSYLAGVTGESILLARLGIELVDCR